jgi:hypothetical protein
MCKVWEDINFYLDVPIKGSAPKSQLSFIIYVKYAYESTLPETTKYSSLNNSFGVNEVYDIYCLLYKNSPLFVQNKVTVLEERIRHLLVFRSIKFESQSCHLLSVCCYNQIHFGLHMGVHMY